MPDLVGGKIVAEVEEPMSVRRGLMQYYNGGLYLVKYAAIVRRDVVCV